MKSIINYLLNLEEDGKELQFYDDISAGLHNSCVYDYIKDNALCLHPFILEGLFESLDGHDIEMIDRCTNLYSVKIAKEHILNRRKLRSKVKKSTHRLNYPIEEVLNDYVNQNKGKLMEAKRQLKKRFDGLEHEWQEKVMLAFMTHGGYKEREFIYDKLYGEDFWVDDYIPLVQKWWECFGEGKLGKVVVKYCSPEYILAHLEELDHKCNYSTLCLRTGIKPDPERLKPWTYLFIMKSNGELLQYREGVKLVYKWIRQYLYESTSDQIVSIYDIPYVSRMLVYLGEMGRVDDIIAIDTFDKSMRTVPRLKWSTAVIKAIEEQFSFPPFIYGEVK